MNWFEKSDKEFLSYAKDAESAKKLLPKLSFLRASSGAVALLSMAALLIFSVGFGRSINDVVLFWLMGLTFLIISAGADNQIKLIKLAMYLKAEK